jgi:FHS family L-fucose permease-like MFS transporter
MPQVERRGRAAPNQALWKYRHLALGAVGIFVYVGAEVSIGSFLINYFSQPNIGNVSQMVAARYVAYYWGGAMVGRFIGSGCPSEGADGISPWEWRQSSPALLLSVSMLSDGTRGHGERHPDRAVQLHHVPQHLHPGHCRTWPVDG